MWWEIKKTGRTVVTFGTLVQCLTECIENKLGPVLPFAGGRGICLVHGRPVVSLCDLRDRLKVTEMNEREIAATIEKSVKEYFKLIKTYYVFIRPINQESNHR